MAAIAQSLPALNLSPQWLWEWLRDELTPYPGRAQLVARMVLAPTLVMIVGRTFRLSFGFQGALYALMISRENIRATVQSAAITCVVTGIGTGCILLLAPFAINVPVLHFLWVVCSFFLFFYVICAVPPYAASVILATIIAVAVPLWDRHGSAEANGDSHRLLNGTVEAILSEVPERLPPARPQSLTILLRRVEDLSSSLSSRIIGGSWRTT